ncbi:MAG: helix-turn-helix domain-containing protein [Desulfobacterales bacterium]
MDFEKNLDRTLLIFYRPTNQSISLKGIMSKKKKYLKPALLLFVENGIDKTPTSKIASEAGVATGTLFHHFKNKEDLVNSLYLDKNQYCRVHEQWY